MSTRSTIANITIEQCERHLEPLRRSITLMENGKYRTGRSRDGYTWEDTTAEDLERYKSQLADTERILREARAVKKAEEEDA